MMEVNPPSVWMRLRFSAHRCQYERVIRGRTDQREAVDGVASKPKTGRGEDPVDAAAACGRTATLRPSPIC